MWLFYCRTREKYVNDLQQAAIISDVTMSQCHYDLSAPWLGFASNNPLVTRCAVDSIKSHHAALAMRLIKTLFVSALIWLSLDCPSCSLFLGFLPLLARLPNESTMLGGKKRNRAADKNYTTPGLRWQLEGRPCSLKLNVRVRGHYLNHYSILFIGWRNIDF